MQSKIQDNYNFNLPASVEPFFAGKKITYIRKKSSSLFDLSAVRYAQKKSFPFQLKMLLDQGVDQIKKILPFGNSRQEALLQDIHKPLHFIPPIGRLEKSDWVYLSPLRLEQPNFSFIPKKRFNTPLVPIRKVGDSRPISFPLKVKGSLKGTLLYDSFLYLKIDENLIQPMVAEYRSLWGSFFESYDTLFPYLKLHGVVISSKEIERFGLQGKIKELGSKVYFGIKSFSIESYEDHPLYTEVLCMEIESPLLEKIQKKYTGLLSPIKVYLGVKRRNSEKIPYPVYLMNLSYQFC